MIKLLIFYKNISILFTGTITLAQQIVTLIMDFTLTLQMKQIIYVFLVLSIIVYNVLTIFVSNVFKISTCIIYYHNFYFLKFYFAFIIVIENISLQQLKFL